MNTIRLTSSGKSQAHERLRGVENTYTLMTSATDYQVRKCNEWVLAMDLTSLVNQLANDGIGQPEFDINSLRSGTYKMEQLISCMEGIRRLVKLHYQ